MADSVESADDTPASSCGDGPDPSPTVDELKDRIAQLEQEQQNLEKDFGCQRAKYRELYDKKEEELQRVIAQNKKLGEELEIVRSEMVAVNLDRQGILSEKNKQDAEIDSLNKLLLDTLEGNEHVLAKCQWLEQELERRDQAQEDKERSSDHLPIHKITQATKSFARKVMELGTDSSTSSAKESLDDDARKDDTEARPTLLIPLEEQIRNLKEKLRISDDRLQKYEKQESRPIDFSTESSLAKSPTRERETDDANGELAAMPPSQIPKSVTQEPLIQLSPTSPMEAKGGPVPDTKASFEENKDLEALLGSGDVSNLASTDEAVSACERCREREDLLTTTQQQLTNVQTALENSEKALQRARDDLNRERTSRQEMESNWNGIKDQYDEQVTSLKEMLSRCESSLREVNQKYLQVVEVTDRRLAELQHHNMKVREEIASVQARNDKILGKYYIRSLDLQNEEINLPNTVPELHEVLLRQREELIAAKTAAETNEEESRMYRTELHELNEDFEREKRVMIDREERNKIQLANLEKKVEEYVKSLTKQKDDERRIRSEREDLKRRLDSESMNRVKLEKENQDYQQKISSLQKSVTDSEIVQKDFVCLSQNLQKQLEVLRTEGTEVRWQHEEDVDSCPNCKNALRHTREKVHCRHCGKIFCNSCLKFTVDSGPRYRPSRVCQVCHTLLNPNTAPYFCKEPLSAPD